MHTLKVVKDHLTKLLFGKGSTPQGLFELKKYFRNYGSIHFDFHTEDDLTVAVSTNFLYGSIVAQGKTAEELDRNIQDAIMTSFEVPSSYAKEAAIKTVGTKSHEYALA